MEEVVSTVCASNKRIFFIDYNIFDSSREFSCKGIGAILVCFGSAWWFRGHVDLLCLSLLPLEFVPTNITEELLPLPRVEVRPNHGIAWKGKEKTNIFRPETGQGIPAGGHYRIWYSVHRISLLSWPFGSSWFMGRITYSVVRIGSDVVAVLIEYAHTPPTHFPDLTYVWRSSRGQCGWQSSEFSEEEAGGRWG